MNNRTIGPIRQRKRRGQRGVGLLASVFNLGKNLSISGTLRKGLDIGSRAMTSGVAKKVIHKGIKHVPELYNYGTKKIKLKKSTEIRYCKLLH